MNTKRRVVTLREVQDLINVIDNAEGRAYVSLGYITGHRINEVLRLTREDFSIVNGTELLELMGANIDEDMLNNISENVNRQSIYMIIYIMTQKTRKDLRDTKHPLILDVKQTPFIKHILLYLKSIKSGKLFLKSDRSYQRYLIGWCKKADIRPLVFHAFRHTRTTKMTLMKTSHFEMMAWFGWKDLRSPAAYYKKSMGNVLALARKIR